MMTRGIIVLFWLAVAAALALPLPQPLDRLLVDLGTVVACLHVIELLALALWRPSWLRPATVVMALVFGLVFLGPHVRGRRGDS